MRSVHFRLSDGMYARVQEEAEAQGVTVAQFAREAAVVRAAIWAYRRGLHWADPQSWDELINIIDRIDRHDSALRAKVARERRERE